MLCNVTVLPATGRDRMGDPTAPAGSEQPYTNCILAPLPPSNDVNARAREGSVTRLTLYLPPGARLEHDQEVRVDSGPHATKVFKVEATPAVWEHPFGGPEEGVEVGLWRAEG